MSEIPSVNLKCGPPFTAKKSCPNSLKATVLTAPFGPPGSSSPHRVMEVIFASLKTLV